MEDGPYTPESVQKAQRWIQHNSSSAIELERQRRSYSLWEHRPLVSFIFFTNQPLEGALQSIIKQTYENFELLIIPRRFESRKIFTDLTFAGTDRRVRIVDSLDEEAPAIALKRAVESIAIGAYLLFLTDDIILFPDLLYHYIHALQGQDPPNLIYSDNSFYSDDSVRLNFKPDWSPELLISYDFLQTSLVSKDLLDCCCQMNAGLEEEHEWDLHFQLAETPCIVHHIHKVLYSAKDSFERDLSKGIIACRKALIAQGLSHIKMPDLEVKVSQGSAIRLHWTPVTHKASIIIPSKDNIHLLRTCISSILSLTHAVEYEIVIVDGGSKQRATLDYYHALSSNPVIRIISFFHGSFNYSKAINAGVAHSAGDILVLLNNDTEVIDGDWLQEAARWAELDFAGVVGGKLLNLNGRIQQAGMVFQANGISMHAFGNSREGNVGMFGSDLWYRNCLAHAGAVQAIRRSVFDEVGGYSERYQLLYSDIEFCLRVYASGLRNIYTPYLRLVHTGGGTRENMEHHRDWLQWQVDYSELMKGVPDPYLNRNLQIRHAR